MKYWDDQDAQFVAEDYEGPPGWKMPRYRTLKLPCGASVTVTGDISEKALAALDDMARTAMREVTAQSTHLPKAMEICVGCKRPIYRKSEGQICDECCKHLNAADLDTIADDQ